MAGRREGFTLVELVATVAVLAVVLGLALPSFRALSERMAAQTTLHALTVALAQTFIGIGFPVGTTPVLQNLVNVTESVLQSIGTLNPINVINALQNGVAGVLLNAITHISDFVVQTVPYIRGVIVDALKAGQPATATRTAEVTSLPTAAADTVTISVPVR